MFDNTQKRLVELRNKLRAYKMNSPLNYGSLVYPKTTPSGEISGKVGNYQEMLSDTVFARFLARFTRSDGIKLTPYVDFAFDYTVSPTLKQQNEALGYEISGRDVEAFYEYAFTGRIIETGNNYVAFAIDVNNYFYAMTDDGQVTITLNVQALSPINGALTLERVYD